jgi:hypothetical protein
MVIFHSYVSLPEGIWFGHLGPSLRKPRSDHVKVLCNESLKSSASNPFHHQRHIRRPVDMKKKLVESSEKNHALHIFHITKIPKQYKLRWFINPIRYTYHKSMKS